MSALAAWRNTSYLDLLASFAVQSAVLYGPTGTAVQGVHSLCMSQCLPRFAVMCSVVVGYNVI
jgi:hypothetical protein